MADLRNASRALALACAVGALTLAPGLRAQPASMVKDIGAEEEDGHSFQSMKAAVGGIVYFAADDGVHGTELWRTDGTSGGTFLVKDLCPGTCPGLEDYLVAWNGKVYFTGDDGASGLELFTSDGTETGTSLVKDVVPGLQSSQPRELIAAGSRLYFVAVTPLGTELWTSLGTEATTQLVADIHPSGSSEPGGLLDLAGTLIFLAADGTHGWELWRTDGTAAGTSMVVDLVPGAAGLPPAWPFESFDDLFPRRKRVVFDGKVVFATNTGAGGALWSTDGTAAGTQLIYSDGSMPSDLSPWNGHLYFLSPTAGLVRTNGSPGGSTVISSAGALTALRAISSGLLAYGTDGQGAEPWFSDGTAGGTARLVDINPGPANSSVPLPQFFVSADDHRAYFWARDAAHGRELWRTDGSAAGTQLVVDLMPGPQSPGDFFGQNDMYPQPFASSGLVFLGRDDATSPHPSLFVTDGTSAGTEDLRHMDAQTSVITVDPFAHDPSLFTSLAGAPFGALLHAVPNRELWMSDGAPVGTQHVATTSGAGYWGPLRATSVNGRAFAHDGGQGLWSIDGTVSSFEQVAATSNTGQYPDPLPIRAGLAYFAQDQDLWATGGTAATTSLVETNAGVPLNFIDDSLYLRHWLPSPAVPELRRWRSGEPSVALGQGEVLRVFRVAGHHLFFVNDELREVVGNTTALVASFPSQRFEGSVATPFGLFFIASDAAGAELWVSDGTTAGTQRFGDLAPGTRSSDPRRLTASSHALYFVADDGVHGRELWRTDGTVAGTRIVRDIVPGPGSSVPEHLAMIDGLLMFSASNGSDGRELWVSNGTEAGTVQIQDIAPGPESSTPHQFVVGKDRVFFIATDAVHGFELWSMSRAALAAAAPPPAIAFFTLPPCRLLDSRDQLGVLFSGTSVSVKAHGLCGVPTTARSLVVNVTVVQPTNSGTFEIGANHPADSPLRLPVVGGTTRASHAILALSKGGDGTFRAAVDLTSGGSTHWLVDVVGYFE